MSEEQKDILQMLADGKISTDDTVKLLEALKTGAQKRSETGSPTRGVKETNSVFREDRGMGFFPCMCGMPEMGRMVNGMMRECVPGMEGVFDDADQECRFPRRSHWVGERY